MHLTHLWEIQKCKKYKETLHIFYLDSVSLILGQFSTQNINVENSHWKKIFALDFSIHLEEGAKFYAREKSQSTGGYRPRLTRVASTQGKKRETGGSRWSSFMRLIETIDRTTGPAYFPRTSSPTRVGKESSRARREPLKDPTEIRLIIVFTVNEGKKKRLATVTRVSI